MLVLGLLLADTTPIKLVFFLNFNYSSRVKHQKQAELIEALRTHDFPSLWPVLLPHLPGGGQHPQTSLNQRSAIKKFVLAAQLERANLLQPSAEFIHVYAASLQGGSAGSVRNTLSHLRGLYQALRALELVPGSYDPFLTLDSPALPARPGEERRFYRAEEISRLIAPATTEDRCLILMGAHAGLRTGEVLKLAWDDVRLSEGRLEVQGRSLPPSPDLEQALYAWSRRQGGAFAEGPVFGFTTPHEVRRRLFTLCAAANVPYRPWQALRAAYALHLWQHTHDPGTMIDQLGIGSLKAVEAYVRMERRLKEAEHPGPG